MLLVPRSVRGTFILILTALTMLTIIPAFFFVKEEQNRERDVAMKAMDNALRLQSAYMARWFELNIMEDIQAVAKLRSVRTMDLEGMAEDFRAMASDRTDLSKLFYFDRNGAPLVDIDNGIISEGTYNVSDRDYFQEAKKGLSTVTDVLDAKDEQSTQIIGFSVPVIREGIFDGVVFGSVHLSHLMDMIQRQSFGESGSFRLFNCDGSPLEGGSEYKPCFYPDHIKDENGLFFTETTENGKSYMTRVVPLAYGGLYIGGTLDLDEVKAGSDRIIRTSMTALTVAIATMLLFFILLSRRITKSINKVQGQLSSASEGEYAPTTLPRMELPLEMEQIWKSVEQLKGKVRSSIDAIRELGIRDSLTGLHNRRYFEDEIAKAAREDHDPVTAVICDVNGLKLVNDALGHEWGDRLITKAASVLKAISEPGDIVARVGGDEFAVLLPNDSGNRDIETRLKEEMASINSGDDIPLQMAWGVANGRASIRSIEEIIKEADGRMYARKETQRDQARDAILTFFLRMISTREGRKVGHMERCRSIMSEFVSTLGEMDETFKDRMIRLAGIHDIGLVGVNPDILRKTDPLTDEEKKEVRSHPEIGYRIAIAAPTLSDLADAILHHHQRWDGTGYPLRKSAVSGKGIPLESRIMTLVDSYEAMTHRYYGRSMTHKEAIEEIGRCRGSQFDPEWADRFVAFLEKKGPGIL